MDENELIVRKFLRKIAPPREWEYLGEVEHYWISQLCDELNNQLKSENAKLRKYAELYIGVVKACGCDLCPYCDDFDTCRDMEVEPMSEGCALYMEMRELGIEVGE